MSTKPCLDLGFTPGDVVVVSGAGSGIGRATALRAAQLGLRVSAWDLNADAVTATVDEISRAGGLATAVTANVSEPDDVTTGFFETRRALGEVRYLVNNAGPSSAVDLDFDVAVQMSLGSVRLMTQTWLSGGVPPEAALVNVASVAGNVIGTESAWYSASKAGITGYTRHLAAHPTAGVRSNAVAPGMTDTPRLAGFAASETGRRALARNPLKRMATPDDIAHAILFLLSPLASYINGVLLPVDGGWTVTQ
ncbi:SDR family oxidoreductase [Streptomyces sp. NPDC046821]|uniref:SDR family NAD(P)-dependent oxidoreductase n=1 Tax=Streptomyces sp. NPDC046821 TaxID=3154702 RepID=UPI0033C08EA4